MIFYNMCVYCIFACVYIIIMFYAADANIILRTRITFNIHEALAHTMRHGVYFTFGPAAEGRKV